MRDTRSVFVRAPLALVLVLTWLWGMSGLADADVRQQGHDQDVAAAHR